MNLQKILMGIIPAFVMVLNGCSSGDSADTPGYLQFQPASNVSVTKGSIRTIELQLAGSSGVVGKPVEVTISDSSVASVAPGDCTLSSVASTCTVTITGKALGSFTISAAGAGYATAQATGQVVATPVWGSISLVGAVNSAVNVTYNDKETAPYPIQFTAKLIDSSGVTSNSNVYAYANTIAGLTFPGGQQCALTTENPTCTLIGQFQGQSTSVSTTVIPSPSASGSINYPVAQNTTTVNLIPSSVGPTPSPTRGTITIATQSSKNQFYAGHSGPLFATWTNGTGGDTYQVTLTSDSSLLQFYGYQPGSTGGQAYPRSLSRVSNGGNQWVTQTCQMNLGGQLTGCGFNLFADPSAPANTTVNISCEVKNLTNPSGEVPVCSVLPVTVGPLPTLNGQVQGRQLLFTNNSQGTVTFGVTSGTVSSYTGPTTTAGTAANSARKAGKAIATDAACGLSSTNASQTQTACPIGASCMQGGQGPGDISATPFYCYFDNPVIAENASYTVSQGGTLNMTIPKVFGSTASTQQIQWSGNFYAYGTDCTACEANQIPGTGPNVAAVTLGEATFQHNTNDYYDVSIINGLNYALEFGPSTNVSPSQSNAYACGTAGSKTAMSGDYVSNPYGYLPASTWSFVVPANYYRLVQGTGSVTGYSVSSSLTNPTFNPSTYTTGSLYGIVTSDQLWGWNSSNTNYWYSSAPFNYGTIVNPSDSATFNYGDLFLCDNNAWTSYGTGSGGPTSQNCGGVNWGAGKNADGTTFATSVGSQITRPNQGYNWTNPAWVNTVLPTIQWLKAGCPTCYTFPFDDPSSTFQCDSAGQFQPGNTQNYLFTISDITTN